MKALRVLIFLVLFLFSLAFPLGVQATPEYASQTGRDCSFCHINPAGGGELTSQGKLFKADLVKRGLYRSLTGFQRVVRLLIGYIHVITAIIWFGTILYVHLILKPEYAAGGLPKGELRVGWISIAIMAVTGTLLTIARMPGLYPLFHTRFGILLTIKIFLFLVMVASAIVVTFYIGPKLKREGGPQALKNKKDMAPCELLNFDGAGGRPAYIAYEGTIYDVTASKLWKEGRHLKKHAAGGDLTEALKGAPHDAGRILQMPKAGKLLTDCSANPRKQKPFHVRLFYFLAYLNLALVFLIVFVISLWRWW